MWSDVARVARKASPIVPQIPATADTAPNDGSNYALHVYRITLTTHDLLLDELGNDL